MMRRRSFLASAAGGLAAPRIARAQGAGVLRFVPYVDLSLLDPVVNTATPTRNHGFLVFDTLYGIEEDFAATPQMVAGHVVDPEYRLWQLTLRDGLVFHDGTPVLARDVVASVRRWAARDGFGNALLAATDALTATSDRVLQFRMKHPFRLLPDALGKMSPSMCPIMPERLAGTDPHVAITEMVGSGPFRFLPREHVPGSRVVYERFAAYRPRADGVPGLTSGPKIARVDRVEWLTIPDPATAAAALHRGEVDWLEAPLPDLVPSLRADRAIAVVANDRSGLTPVLRFNCIQRPFDNPAIRRAVLQAVDQSEFMSAYSNDASMWRVKIGAFCPGTPMASDAGLDGLFGRTDVARARRALTDAGYGGERVVLLLPSDHPISGPIAEVAADLLQRIGMNVDAQTMDTGTLFQRRNSRADVDHGGWSLFPSMVSGINILNPAVSEVARGNGLAAWYGWPTSAALEALHDRWLDAPDQAAQRAIAAEVQRQLWEDAVFVPTGQIFQPIAYRKSLSGILQGFVKFYNVRKNLS